MRSPGEGSDWTKALRMGGIAVWVMAAGPVFLGAGALDRARLAGWAVAQALFLALFLLDARRPRLWWPAGQAACVVALVLLLCDGFEGALLVLVALQLGTRLSRRAGLAWIAVQSALLGVAIGIHWAPRAALLLAPPYLGFQALGLLLASALASESRARSELRAAHAHLEEQSRLEERLRISRELHDAVGHHLTALRLNLEVASRGAGASQAEALKSARSLGDLLLTELRSAVAALREPDRFDLRAALEALAEQMPRPRIHLSLPPVLGLRGERALVLLRCAQELAANAARHAGAENLWLEIAERDGRWELDARDDGRGAAQVHPGNGLSGLRERVEREGGALTIDTGPGDGFCVRASLPAEAAA